MLRFSVDVLIAGAGAAGMYAAIAAARAGATVLLVDKGQIGRGGATVMAQMTVAAALAEEEPDSVALHLDDTLKAGRGLCNEELAALVCSEGPKRIREMEAWGTRWAREGQRIKQVMAPGHSVKRCCYVDFLNTGPAVAATLRRKITEFSKIRRVSNFAVVEILVCHGRVIGAIALDLTNNQLSAIRAPAVVISAGGLTKLYARNSASANMVGEAYALALWAGAELIDMEFVQFFPIGHLAPRLVGMDPIMWDPFRYKLGGRLLNAEKREFLGEEGRYATARDHATYAILKEVAERRGSPHGGVWLSFEHCSAAQLRAAFGPIIDRLIANGIDLTRAPIEVAPIAHYHMGGIRVDADMRTSVPNLYAAGEAVGGANGANRLSGNAITEAFTFGRRAGLRAAALAAKTAMPSIREKIERKRTDFSEFEVNAAMEIARLQQVMNEYVGPLRTHAGLERALEHINELASVCQNLPEQKGGLDPEWIDLHDLRNMRLVAECIARAALVRTESRGAHQREDFPETSEQWAKHQAVRLGSDGVRLEG